MELSVFIAAVLPWLFGWFSFYRMLGFQLVFSDNWIRWFFGYWSWVVFRRNGRAYKDSLDLDVSSGFGFVRLSVTKVLKIPGVWKLFRRTDDSARRTSGCPV